jgi:hypothetical protein
LYKALRDWAYYAETNAECEYARLQLVDWLKEQDRNNPGSNLSSEHVFAFIAETLDKYLPCGYAVTESLVQEWASIHPIRQRSCSDPSKLGSMGSAQGSGLRKVQMLKWIK